VQQCTGATRQLANRAVDLLAMGGVATLALADVWSCHVAWWPASEATVVRIWSSAALTMKVQAAAVVRGPDGYLRVFYDKLGLKFQTYDEWISSGARLPTATLVAR